MYYLGRALSSGKTPENKMADINAFGGVRPSTTILPSLWRIRSDFLCRTDNISHLNTIGAYFRELCNHSELLDAKYHHENTAFRSMECFVNTRPMVAKLLFKIHKKIHVLLLHIIVRTTYECSKCTYTYVCA